MHHPIPSLAIHGHTSTYMYIYRTQHHPLFDLYWHSIFHFIIFMHRIERMTHILLSLHRSSIPSFPLPINHHSFAISTFHIFHFFVTSISSSSFNTLPLLLLYQLSCISLPFVILLSYIFIQHSYLFQHKRRDDRNDAVRFKMIDCSDSPWGRAKPSAASNRIITCFDYCSYACVMYAMKCCDVNVSSRNGLRRKKQLWVNCAQHRVAQHRLQHQVCLCAHIDIKPSTYDTTIEIVIVRVACYCIIIVHYCILMG